MKRILLPIFLLLTICCLVYAAEQNAAGIWDIQITFAAGSSNHTAIIKQDGDQLSGVYKGDYKEGSLTGTIEGEKITLHAHLSYPGRSLNYHYSGTISGDTITGSVDLATSHVGEYGTATFAAARQ